MARPYKRYVPDTPLSREVVMAAGMGEDTTISDSLARVRAGLAQVPDGKRGVFVAATTLKWGMVPTVSFGTAWRVGKGWEIQGEGFWNKMDAGATLRVVRAW